MEVQTHKRTQSPRESGWPDPEGQERTRAEDKQAEILQIPKTEADAEKTHCDAGRSPGTLRDRESGKHSREMRLRSPDRQTGLHVAHRKPEEGLAEGGCRAGVILLS